MTSTSTKRCAERYRPIWDDVGEGEALPTMLKGPMTLTGLIAYAQGWGGLYIRANKLHHPSVGMTPQRSCIGRLNCHCTVWIAGLAKGNHGVGVRP